jgi:hypothetical protein
MQEENTAPRNSLRQREVLQMVNLSPSLRCLFLIAALLCLPHSALALNRTQQNGPADMLTLARTTIIIALLMAIQPAYAQRCPAGADAFLNCLLLDHRYGGP